MKTFNLPLIALMLMTSACGSKGGDAPTGQVVATVNGQEITAADLRFETGGLSSNNPAIQKQIEQAALQTIINRFLITDAAKEQKIDQTPTAALAKRKAEQMALVQILEQKLRAGVPKPSREEALQYIAENPSSFTNRKIFVVDQMIVPSITPEVAKQLEPLDTLEQVQALLEQNKIAFSRVVGTIDALTIDGAAAEKIASLAPNTVFVNPDGAGVRINRIRDTEVRPLEGEEAVRLALDTLQNRRIQQQVSKQFENIISAGMGKVSYNEKFRPAPPPKAPPAQPAKN